MTSFGSRFLDLVERSVIVQAAITLILISTLAYLWIAGKPVDQNLLVLTFTVIGFWFGSKVENAKHSLRQPKG